MPLAPYWAATAALIALGATAIHWAIHSTRQLRKEQP